MINNNELKVISVNISIEKGTIKKPIHLIELNEKGILGDAHAGNWHRQISMLGTESISKFEKQANRSINHGEFAENITTQGIELFKCLPLDKFFNDKVELEVTQIGKECHGHTCNIFREVGNCVMPKEGIFARVIKCGPLQANDILQYSPKVFRIKLITLSDRASQGEYDDRSGKRIIEMLEEFFGKENLNISIDYKLIPDDAEQLKSELIDAKNRSFDFIFTCGGTGIGIRDITVDVVKQLLDKEIPGIMDMIRLKYGQDKPNALISRSIAGLMGESIVYTLPGSLKAVQEYMTELFKTMIHLVYMLHSIDSH